jgi:hypothetical protein
MKNYFTLIITSAALTVGGNRTLHGQSGSAGLAAGDGAAGGSADVTTVTVQSPEPPEAPEPPTSGRTTVIRTDIQPVQLDAQEQIEKAQSQLDILNDQFFHASGTTSPTLVLRSADADPKDDENLEEDLAVMSHILDKAAAGERASRPGARSAAGINILFAPAPTPPRNLYLDGYGALFMINVNFPLLAPPAEAGTAKAAQPTNSAWEEARHELYGHGDQNGNKGPWGADRVGGPGEPYSEERVAQLKAALLDALKNGTNIRTLKTDDWITVCVLGPSVAGEFRAQVKKDGAGGGGYGPQANPFANPAASNWKAFGTVPPHHSVLTVRVKKSDVDAFAKGDLDAAKFQKKVNVLNYISGGGQE